MAFVPPALALAGAFQKGIAAHNADAFNSQAATNEAKVSIDQANQQEGLQRRASREALSRQTAAFGASGAGYGGSSATALNQSAINQEMDALDTRYKGQITSYGYDQEASLDKSKARNDTVAGGLLAGGAAIDSINKQYPDNPWFSPYAALVT